MTETQSRLIEAATSYLDLSVATFAVYLTLVSGYLIVAYIAGRELSRTQLVIINSLFVVSTGITALSSYRYAFDGATFGAELVATGGAVPLGEVAYYGAYLLGAILVTGILAALYFMWSTRRSDEEDEATT